MSTYQYLVFPLPVITCVSSNATIEGFLGLNQFTGNVGKDIYSAAYSIELFLPVCF